MDRIYLVDSNVFITAKNQYYSFNICPGFWKSIIQHYQKGRIFGLDRVRSELLVYPKTEDLVKWVKSEVPKDFFLPSDAIEIVRAYGNLMLWVDQNLQYSDRAKAKFARGADGWLVAYAQVRPIIVVTNEQPAPDSKRIIKLPDVCNQFGVRWEDTFSMLQSLNIQFDLRKSDN